MDVLCNLFSQTAQVRARKAKGLHPVNELQRFGILVCCFFCSICVSLAFVFELLSSEFKTRYNLSPGDMSTISTVGLVFCYFLLPFSFFYEFFGPAINFAISGIIGFIGAIGLGLTFQGKMPGNLASITVFYACLNTSAGLFDSTYITVLFEVFPRNRGPIIGLTKVMTGMGASILSCVCSTIFDGDVIVFCYFLAVFLVIVSVFAILFVSLPPYYMNWWRRRGKTPEQIAELESVKPYYERKFVPKARLITGYVVAVMLIVFFAVEAPVLEYVTVPRSGRIAVGVVCIVLTVCLTLPALPALPSLLAFLCCGLCDADDEDGCQKGSADSTEGGNSVENATALPAKAVERNDSCSPTSDTMIEESPATKHFLEEAKAISTCRQDPRYPADTFWDYLKLPELWLLLAYMTCAQPLGILISYNTSHISVALTSAQRSSKLSTLYSAFLGVGNSIGRILFGLFEAYVQHQDPANRKVLITTTLFVPPILIAIGGVLVQVIPGDAILLSFIIVYVKNGYNAALAALLFTSLFESFHNALYCVGFIATVFCVIIFNRVLFGIWGDKQLAKLGLSSSDDCNAKSCVRMPLIVVTVLGVFSVVFALALHIRYSRYVRRTREAAAAALETHNNETAESAPDGVKPSVEPL